MMKRCLSLILSFALLLTLLPLSAIPQAKAESVAAEGFSDMGKLLAEAAQQDQAASPEEYPGGYALTDLTVTKKLATVEYAALEDATVLVAVYAEDGLQMLASGNAPALAAETSVQVELTGSVPTYFRVAAFLVRTGDLSPLCEPLESSRYTKDIQTLIKSTVSDYPEDRVINLDGDKKTNFMVMQEGTVQLQSSETANRLVSVDRENKRYVIENADASVAGLQPGDNFVHNVDGEDWIIAKVQSVTVDGTTVTIQGEDPKMEEVFSHVKIETEGTAEELKIDTTTLSPGVTYEGITQIGSDSAEPVPATRSLVGEDEDTLNIPLAYFTIDAELAVENGNVEQEVSGALSVMLGIRIKYHYYYTDAQTYTELKMDSGLFLDGELKGKFTGKVCDLGDWMWTPIPGVSIGFEPFVGVELSGEAKMNFSIAYTTKWYYDPNIDGYRCAAPAPVVGASEEEKPENLSVDVKGDIFLGLDFNPTVEVLGGLLLDVDVTALVGLMLTGQMSGTAHKELAQLPEDPDAEIPDQLHSCKECVAGEIHVGVKLGFEVKILGAEILGDNKSEILLSYKLSDYYFCLTCPLGAHNRVGLGFCPERRFRITVEALDEQSDPVANAVVLADGSEIDRPVVNMGTTNQDGIVTAYIAGGNHAFRIQGSDMPENRVNIAGAGKVRIDGSYLYYVQTNPGSALSPILDKIMSGGVEVASGTCGPDAKWSITSAGRLDITGSGAVTETPWKEQEVKVQVAVIHEGITDLGNTLFNYENKLFSVQLPNTLKTLGNGVFGNTRISSIVIPEGVTTMGSGVFNGCSLLESVTLPGSLQEFGVRTFAGCKELDTVILPRGLTVIPEYAFSGCTGLKAVSIPNTVTHIEQYAFDRCGALVRAKLPDSVRTLGDYVFYYCRDLTDVTLSANMTNIPSGTFYYCEALYQLHIPASVTVINSHAFAYSGLVQLELSDSVKQIDVALFRGCTSLESVRLPSGITEIPNIMFENCSSLRTITIPQSVTDIGGSAFEGCASLVTVTIPDSVTEIGDEAFRGCSGLTEAKLPSRLTKLNSALFAGCKSLQDIEIPSTVTEISGQVFQGCESLTNITLPYGVQNVADRLFDGCTSLKEVNLPVTVSKFEYRSFGNCGLVEYEIPSHVTSLGQYTFADCVNLKSIVIPESIIEIPASCFDSCFSLAEVSISDSVTEFGVAAFRSCTALEYIDLPDNITQVTKLLFDRCSSLKEITLPEKVATIGEGAFQWCEGLVSVKVPDTLTVIDDYAFNFSGLEEIEIPEGVVKIGEYAFKLSNLREIRIPSTVEEWGKSAFFECNSLKSVEISEGVTEIPSDAFRSCTNLASVDIPDSMQVFGHSAFNGCARLEGIYIPQGTTYIGGFAFAYCFDESENEVSVTIPGSVTYLGDQAFAYCNKVVTKVGEDPVLQGLSTVYFEGNAPQGSSWFLDSNMGIIPPSIKMTVYYPEGDSTWTQEVMDNAEWKNLTKDIEWIPYTPAAAANTVAVKAAAPIREEETRTARDAEAKAPATRKVIGGEYTQEEVEGKTLRTASFDNLTPGQSYLLLAVVNAEADPLLDPGNLLYVTQVTADANGKVTQRYIQRTETELSFVMLCGAAEQDLKDATVNFPAMTAGEEEKTVCPVVEYNGKQLVEGMDYRIEGQASYNKPGTYTCIIRGMNNYIGFVECTYTVTDCIPGDLNGDGLVTDADAVYLLRHTLFPAKYPVTQDGDFNGDGLVIDSDAIYLLRHTLFPGSYPLH